jgi:hypothetical protein
MFLLCPDGENGEPVARGCRQAAVGFATTVRRSRLPSFQAERRPSDLPLGVRGRSPCDCISSSSRFSAACRACRRLAGARVIHSRQQAGTPAPRASTSHASTVVRPSRIAYLVSSATLRAIPPFEFENWAVIALGGIPNKVQVGDMGVDGRIFPVGTKPSDQDSMFADDWFPVQVKQTDRVGRPDIDAFEAVMEREGAHGRRRGFFGGGKRTSYVFAARRQLAAGAV